MNQQKTSQKVLFELIKQGIILPSNALVVEQYINQVFSIGYDNGMNHRPNKISILQLNNAGMVIDEFDSYADAGKKTKIDFRNIHKVVNGIRSTAGGYYWKLK